MTSDDVRTVAVWIASAVTSVLFLAASTSFAHGM